MSRRSSWTIVVLLALLIGCAQQTGQIEEEKSTAVTDGGIDSDAGLLADSDAGPLADSDAGLLLDSDPGDTSSDILNPPGDAVGDSNVVWASDASPPDVWLLRRRV